MRIPKFLSPTSIEVWENDPELFYGKYLSDYPPEREPQTLPMSIGAAFDAYVKSYLHDRFIGKNPEYEFQTLFEKQVEPQNRDTALEDGGKVWKIYQEIGALDDIIKDLEKGENIRFETEIIGDVNGVPLLGRPDLCFSLNGEPVIFDWKVNGYYSKWGATAKKWYVKLREDGGIKMHKEVQPIDKHGILINIGGFFENVDKQWARQLSIYSWIVTGQCCAHPFIAAIDQVVCNNGKISVASHRGIISVDFQNDLLNTVTEIWEIINSGWIFRGMDEELSKAKQLHMDDIGKRRKIDQDFIDNVIK